MRTGRLLRCLGNELSVPLGSHTAVLSRVFCPKIQSPELASLAVETIEVIPQLDLLHTVAVLDIFSRHGIRHEPLMFGCLWKVFKAESPTSLCQGHASLMQGFAVRTATAFRIMCQHGLVHDPQLVAIALGRCTECAPHMTLGSVVDVYEAVKEWDRKFFSIAEAALHSGGASEEQMDDVSSDSPTLFSSQPNMMDVLCGELESRLISVAREDYEASVQDAERLLGSLAAVGVATGDVVLALCQLIKPLKVTADSLLKMMVSLHQVHMRVVDVLDYNANDWDIQSARRELVKTLTAKLLSLRSRGSFARHCDRQLVVGFRRLFEKYPALADDAPQLWDAVRAVRVPQKEVMKMNEPCRFLGGELFKGKYAVKVKPVTTSAAEVERFVPPQFKTWSGPSVGNNRHKSPKTPRVVGFGVQKISKDYIKMKRKKFAPSVW
ncbi:hypothetical protein, conserved [Trypanosoma brucei gambiense DAL972]|uniref:Uncharacterized protein n=1 Tax=Trypanosoma brucei gambiense (strain MHOM/CI/86/DAL972) TaxID=679716 RepID=D0A5N1_TRYB9|nr:hypothetical protein, conserved [Trypanosoma brucei gambiense DAL972]CBH16982.1 hypothetical protein, conserved [Trypanosoma brucei gambiense DAL972]|eukprot:XP_011779246.1 hypothetical protein, conserved [Trypanosoma brucei gambiense DAL972]